MFKIFDSKFNDEKKISVVCAYKDLDYTFHIADDFCCGTSNYIVLEHVG